MAILLIIGGSISLVIPILALLRSGGAGGPFQAAFDNLIWPTSMLSFGAPAMV